ncbi:TRAP transporter large permease subunit [Brevibacterium aurantiacum]|nr:TRAP transporter large permease subunit [Brevibacterium aurantiacum]
MPPPGRVDDGRGDRRPLRLRRGLRQPGRRLVNILLLFVGCVMETSSAILILAPILLPIAMELGIEPIHFGIIVVMNLEIGMITPPLGLNLFVASGMSGMSVVGVAKAALPSALVLLAALALVTFVPFFATAFVGS